jgi:phage portal protein BeeE
VQLDNVFHVRYLSVAESLVGLNPIEYLRNVLGGARAQDLYGNSFFQNSARADVVIEVPEDLDEEETLALAKAWKAAHQGLGQANLPGVLTGGAKLSTRSRSTRRTPSSSRRASTAPRRSQARFSACRPT